MGSGMCKFCTYHFTFQFSLFEDVVDVLRNDRTFPSEQQAHLLLRQPYRLTIRLHLKTDIFFTLIHYYLLIHALILCSLN